mgnify:CR=1 FL=1
MSEEVFFSYNTASNTTKYVYYYKAYKYNNAIYIAKMRKLRKRVDHRREEPKEYVHKRIVMTNVDRYNLDLKRIGETMDFIFRAMIDHKQHDRFLEIIASFYVSLILEEYTTYKKLKEGDDFRIYNVKEGKKEMVTEKEHVMGIVKKVMLKVRRTLIRLQKELR